ncbi:hypothetical protein BDK51DRAFT_28688 [Blyttiomyces helicus]|uniref:Uncharacterized protein n=1 Tax=Blyttiomyces helicus TaxID=388810 RepID=A0A4P9W874_9FUNG|nr:hypothetical protein BDK51DRAFT_28688 [Blyttiomyces helicus]|eukprot:RKO88721.1 hypothetical protein BDK51DRAFT_28688 [Blyttiomyces helicus]
MASSRSLVDARICQYCARHASRAQREAEAAHIHSYLGRPLLPDPHSTAHMPLRPQQAMLPSGHTTRHRGHALSGLPLVRSHQQPPQSAVRMSPFHHPCNRAPVASFTQMLSSPFSLKSPPSLMRKAGIEYPTNMILDWNPQAATLETAWSVWDKKNKDDNEDEVVNKYKHTGSTALGDLWGWLTCSLTPERMLRGVGVGVLGDRAMAGLWCGGDAGVDDSGMFVISPNVE